METNACVEICIALEDFIYGGYAKVSIPSLNPLMSKTEKSVTTQKININNLMNKDKSKFQSYNKAKCSTSNYVQVKIPEELYRYRNHCSKKLTYKGYKGEQFAISFIGGDLNQPIVLRRL